MTEKFFISATSSANEWVDDDSRRFYCFHPAIPRLIIKILHAYRVWRIRRVLRGWAR